MTIYDVREVSPQEQAAIEDLEQRVRDRYPNAAFDVSVGGDPDGVYLTVTVDLDDTGEVIDHVLDRLIEVQFEQGLPVYVLTRRPSPSDIEPEIPAHAVG